MRCSCHRAKCGRCFECSKCGCNCPPIQRKKRRVLHEVDYNDEVNEEETENHVEAAQDLLIDSIPKLRNAFGLNENSGRGMPNYAHRSTKDLEELDHEKKARMVHFASGIIKSVCKIVYPKNPESLAHACAVKFKKEDSESKLQNNVKRLANALPPRSVQRRVVLGLVSSSYANSYLQSEFGLGRDVITAARKGFKYMLEGNILKPVVKSVATYDAVAVERAVQFILNEVYRVSWGTRTILLVGEKVEFPRLIRKKVVEFMLRDYRELYQDPADRIGNTSFKKVAKALTSSDNQTKDSDSLISDTIDLIRRIIGPSNESLIRMANALEVFLHTDFENHIDGDCPVTARDFAFSSDTSVVAKRCRDCETPHRVIKEFCLKVIDHPVNQKLLDDCSAKLRMYQAQRVRASNQRSAIDEILKTLLFSQSLIVLGFKMKFESTANSWHGAMVYYKEQPSSSDEEVVSQPHHVTYYDHIASGDYTQDSKAVMSYFEAVCLRIKSCTWLKS